ncbi:MAG: hypothetical protein K5695_14835 [Oscillospiraceae bacterium]|nr:hypothetical protein [Oscillospiraceae bacterium]
MQYTVEGGEMSEAEVQAYLHELRRLHPERNPTELHIRINGEFVDISYQYETAPFERIRRITGYLVGSLDRFNDAKRAEESERVKHQVDEEPGLSQDFI